MLAMEVGIMDKQYGYMESKHITKRPRWLTLCMMATAASVITLAGCGDEEPPVPAEEPSPLEQDATSEPEPSMNEEPMTQQDSSLEAESASEGSMTQDNGADSEAPASSQGMSDENMPEDTMDEPVEGGNNSDEDEAGFGEGTDPMPGAEDDENSTSNQ
ncbi:hypothetical protein HSBAA_49000 [Vreelandella sulfidaeris]|uniref:Uncharacterized protein n=1 Tax=Vreelandella sulfidaeris TaxID=115553 RepID=A0A455UKX0_9GAMM|nr:hypothetical protein HSBAA_49000 [Halomonas sulfidaeris]